MSQSNGQQTITAGSWTNIGTGPLTINLQSLSLSVNVVVSDTQPADNAQGNILSQARPSMQVSNAQAVWVRGVPSWTNSSGTAIIDVLLGTPGASGGGASEAHIGEVGGNIGDDIKTVANSAVTYAAGQVIGTGAIKLSNAGRVAGKSGVITGAEVTLAGLTASNTAQIDVILFHTNPTNTTFTDAAALNIAAADLPKILCACHVNDWTATTASSSSAGQSPTEARPIKCNDTTDTTSIWAVLVARGSIQLTAASSVTLQMRYMRN